MKDCIRHAPMLGAREGEIDAAERAALEAHLGACPACQARLADQRALEGMVGEALMRRRGRDFTAFADQVIPVAAAGRSAPLPRHRVLAVGSALAPTLAARRSSCTFSCARGGRLASWSSRSSTRRW
jgi:anti-sigma factor RsiW